MRPVTPLLAALLIVPLLAADEPRGHDGATLADELEGSWQLVGVEAGLGRPVAKFAGPYRMTFGGGRWVLATGTARVTGAYMTDAGRTPASLDKIADGGRGVRRCIYRLDGGTLRIAERNDRDDRPDGFTGNGVLITVWEREKK